MFTITTVVVMAFQARSSTGARQLLYTRHGWRGACGGGWDQPPITTASISYWTIWGGLDVRHVRHTRVADSGVHCVPGCDQVCWADNVDFLVLANMTVLIVYDARVAGWLARAPALGLL